MRGLLIQPLPILASLVDWILSFISLCLRVLPFGEGGSGGRQSSLRGSPTSFCVLRIEYVKQFLTRLGLECGLDNLRLFFTGSFHCDGIVPVGFALYLAKFLSRFSDPPQMSPKPPSEFHLGLPPLALGPRLRTFAHVPSLPSMPVLCLLSMADSSSLQAPRWVSSSESLSWSS